MALNNVVVMYRALNCPKLQNQQFAGEFVTTEETNAAFLELLSGAHDARVMEASSDGEDLLLSDVDLKVGSTVTAKFRVGSNNAEKFYPSYNKLLSSASIRAGKVPDSFYIEQADHFFSSDDQIDDEDIFNQLNVICEVIRGLKELAHYYDKTTSTSPNKLVFLAADENKSRPIVLDICLNESVLTSNLSDISVLTSLLDDEAKLGAHFEPKKSIFYSSLGEFVAGFAPESAFCKLIENWSEFATVYQRNHSTYLSGFAFHKAKKEVAESEIKLAEHLSKVTSDLTGKLFSIPISVAAIVAMFHKDSTLITNGFVVFGLLLTAILIVGIVANQKNQLESVKQAKEIIEQSIEGKKSSYPPELVTHVENMSTRLDGNIATAENWLFIFRLLAWLPALVGTIVFYYQYSYGMLISNLSQLFRM